MPRRASVEKRLEVRATDSRRLELAQIQPPRQHGHHDARAVVADGVLRRTARAALGRLGDDIGQCVGAPFRARQHRRRAAGAVGLAGLLDDPVVLHARREVRRAQNGPFQGGAAAMSRCPRPCSAQPATSSTVAATSAAMTPPPTRHDAKATDAARELTVGRTGGPLSSRPRTASMSRWAASRSAMTSSWASRRAEHVDVVGDPEPGPSGGRRGVRRASRAGTRRCPAGRASACRTPRHGRNPAGSRRRRTSRPRRTASPGRGGSRSRPAGPSQCRSTFSAANSMSASSRPSPATAPRAGLHGVVDAPAQHLEAAADTEHRAPGPGVRGDARRPVRARAATAGRRRWPCCRGSRRRRRRPPRRGRWPSGPARRARRPAPRRRWSWRCAAAGSRPPAATARRAGGAARRPRWRATTDTESSASSHSVVAEGHHPVGGPAGERARAGRARGPAAPGRRGTC